MHYLHASLASILASPLHGRAWYAACQQLEAAWAQDPAGFDAANLAEIETKLSAFPAEHRSAPQGWRALGDLPWSCPLYALTTTRSFGGWDDTAGAPSPVGDADLPALMASSALQGARRLGFYRHCALSADSLRALLAHAGLSELEGLSFIGCSLSLAEVVDALLATAPASLKSLTLSGFEADAASLERLLRAGLGQRLERLTLSNDRSSTAHVDRVAELELPGLRRLSVSYSALPEASFARLLVAPGLRGLERLSVTECALGLGASPALRRAALPGLRRLALQNCGLESGAAAAIAQRFPTLTHLDLSQNALDDEALAAVVGSPLRESLESLSLGQQGIRQSGLAAVGVAGGFPALRTLELNHSYELTALGVEALAAWPLPALERLDLSACRLGPLGIGRLTASAYARGLQELDLDNTWGGPQGVAQLADAELPALERLRAGLNRADDASLTALMQSEGLPALRFLDLTQPGKVTTAPFKAKSALRALRGLELGALRRQTGPVAGAIVANTSLHPVLRCSWMERASTGALKACAKAEGIKGISRMGKPALLEALASALAPETD